jgi:hypothetical protein
MKMVRGQELALTAYEKYKIELREREAINPKFKIGEKVFFTNSYGVKIGERTVTKIVSWYGDDCRYYTTPTDAPWFPTDESLLTAIK